MVDECPPARRGRSSSSGRLRANHSRWQTGLPKHKAPVEINQEVVPAGGAKRCARQCSTVLLEGIGRRLPVRVRHHLLHIVAAGEDKDQRGIEVATVAPLASPRGQLVVTCTMRSFTAHGASPVERAEAQVARALHFWWWAAWAWARRIACHRHRRCPQHFLRCCAHCRLASCCSDHL